MSAPQHARSPAPEAWRSDGATPPLVRRRLAWVDMLRGAALVGMVAYHSAWDLHAFAISATDPGQELGWRLLGRGVAGLFLMLSGFSLSLAARRGTSRRAEALRLGKIAAAAATISLATRIAVPEAPIWFGILHCMVVTNMLALAMRPLPDFVLLGVAAAALMAPFVFHGSVGPVWAWTGLAANEPTTLDFRPILPWLAPVLVGMVLGRTTLATSPDPTWLSTPIAGILAWAGRHSLTIYMAHQPLLIAALAVTVGLPQQPPSRLSESLRDPQQAMAFLQQCRSACTAKTGDEALCSSTCHCVLTNVLGAAPSSRPSSIVSTHSRDLDAAAATCERAPMKGNP